MTAVALPHPVAPATPTGAAFRTVGQLIRSLGNVPPDRIMIQPPPGTATVQDVVRLVDEEKSCRVELVNGTLVEKPVGLRESIIAVRLIRRLANVVEPGRLGHVSGEAGMIRMLMGNIRLPDVAFFRREDLPGGQLPAEPAPRLPPALAVEVLSRTNTDEEMDMKIREYFQSGARLVWMIDPDTQTARVYRAPEQFQPLARDDLLDGGDVVPGFSVRIGELLDL